MVSGYQTGNSLGSVVCDHLVDITSIHQVVVGELVFGCPQKRRGLVGSKCIVIIEGILHEALADRDLLWHAAVQNGLGLVVIDVVTSEVQVDAEHTQHVAVFNIIVGYVVVADGKALVVVTCGRRK